MGAVVVVGGGTGETGTRGRQGGREAGEAGEAGRQGRQGGRGDGEAGDAGGQGKGRELTFWEGRGSTTGRRSGATYAMSRIVAEGRGRWHLMGRRGTGRTGGQGREHQHTHKVFRFPAELPFCRAPCHWFSHIAFCVRVLASTGTAGDTGTHPPILGAFYIKPNYPGICSHVCNGGFVVHRSYRGLGLGRMMGEAFVGLAKGMVGGWARAGEGHGRTVSWSTGGTSYPEKWLLAERGMVFFGDHHGTLKNGF